MSGGNWASSEDSFLFSQKPGLLSKFYIRGRDCLCIKLIIWKHPSSRPPTPFISVFFLTLQVSYSEFYFCALHGKHILVKLSEKFQVSGLPLLCYIILQLLIVKLTGLCFAIEVFIWEVVWIAFWFIFTGQSIDTNHKQATGFRGKRFTEGYFNNSNCCTNYFLHTL